MVLAGEAQVQVTRQGVQADRAIEGEVVRAPAHRLAGIGHRLRPAQVIGVEVVQLGGVADHRHRLTAQVHVLEVVALGRQELVLDPQPAVGLVAEPGLLAGTGALVRALAQGVDLVIGHDAVPGAEGQGLSPHGCWESCKSKSLRDDISFSITLCSSASHALFKAASKTSSCTKGAILSIA